MLVAGAESLPFADGRFDAVLSQLVVNFEENARASVLEMRRVACPGAVVAGCVWDYRAGMTLLHSLWDAAIDLGLPNAAARDQGRTMPFCTPAELSELWHGAELTTSRPATSRPPRSTQASTICGHPMTEGFPCWDVRTSLNAIDRAALRGEVFARLGSPHSQFKLSARGFWARGRR